MSNWISIRECSAEDLPNDGQEILFVNDVRENTHSLITRKLFHPEKDVREVMHGWVHELNVANVESDDHGEHENWIACRASKIWSSVIGSIGHGDCITHWKPMPELPMDKKRGD